MCVCVFDLKMEDSKLLALALCSLCCLALARAYSVVKRKLAGAELLSQMLIFYIVIHIDMYEELMYSENMYVALVLANFACENNERAYNKFRLCQHRSANIGSPSKQKQ